MRRLADADLIRRFMRTLALSAGERATVYFTGGASAVLDGWRPSTIDVDLTFEPDRDDLFRALPAIKEQLQINVELAAPSDFIPELPDWRERSRFIASESRLEFFHYDFYSQALSKIERGHAQDRSDVAAMLERGLVQPGRLVELFEKIAPRLYRYPAIDPAGFRRALEQTVGQGPGERGSGDSRSPEQAP